MHDVLARLPLTWGAVGPEERKVALWMGLISMWACGYVIESPVQYDGGSSIAPHQARETPYPVRARPQRLLHILNALGGMITYVCADISPAAAAAAAAAAARQPVYPKTKRATASKPAAAEPAPPAAHGSLPAKIAPIARRRKRQWSRRKPALPRKEAEAAGLVPALDTAAGT